MKILVKRLNYLWILMKITIFFTDNYNFNFHDIFINNISALAYNYFFLLGNYTGFISCLYCSVDIIPCYHFNIDTYLLFQSINDSHSLLFQLINKTCHPGHLNPFQKLLSVNTHILNQLVFCKTLKAKTNCPIPLKR